jgi:hypothetical protein
MAGFPWNCTGTTMVQLHGGNLVDQAMLDQPVQKKNMYLILPRVCLSASLMQEATVEQQFNKLGKIF